MASNGHMAPWLLVAKPLRSPFVDGSTVMVRDLVRALPASRALGYFGDAAQPIRASSCDVVVNRAAMGHQPGLQAKLAVLAGIVHPRRRHWPLHFFFTPNALTSRVLSCLARLDPSRPMIQSVMSADAIESRVELLQGLDRVIVLSDATRRRVLAAGLPDERVCRIYPGVPSADRALKAERSSSLLFAGDLDAVVVDRLLSIADMLAERSAQPRSWVLDIVARPKSENDAEHRRRLRLGLDERLASDRWSLAGRVDDLPQRMARASLQLFLADHVRKKVDLPLVLLEGLALGLPVFGPARSPVGEIFERARDRSVEIGVAVPDGVAPEQWATQLASTLEHLDINGAPEKAPERWQSWSEGARALAEQEFSSATMAVEYERLYAELSHV